MLMRYVLDNKLSIPIHYNKFIRLEVRKKYDPSRTLREDHQYKRKLGEAKRQLWLEDPEKYIELYGWENYK